jgi:hypothetical protein
MKLRTLTERIGRRGATLAALGLVDIVYGSAIVWTTSLPSPGEWWPASQDIIFRAPTYAWGWVWFVVGLILWTGVFARKDDVHFVLAIMLKVIWAMAAAFYWVSSDLEGLWGNGAIYSGLALLTFIIAGWAEPPPRSSLEPLLLEHERQGNG